MTRDRGAPPETMMRMRPPSAWRSRRPILPKTSRFTPANARTSVSPSDRPASSASPFLSDRRAAFSNSAVPSPPFAVAFCTTAAWNFSNRRGTPHMMVGRTSSRFSLTVVMLSANAMMCRVANQPISSTLANECASGRKSSCTSSVRMMSTSAMHSAS